MVINIIISDDTVQISETKDGIKELTRKVEMECRRYKMKTNVDKT